MGFEVNVLKRESTMATYMQTIQCHWPRAFLLLKEHRYLRLVALATGGLFMSLVIALLVLVFIQQTLVRHSGDTVAAAAAHTASRLDRLLYERAGDGQMMARAFVDRLNDRDFLSAYVTWMAHAYPVYEWLAVLDTHGTIIAANRSEWISQNRANAAWFAQLVQSPHGLVLDGKIYAESNGQVAVGFASPIRDRMGHVQGYVAAFVSLAMLEKTYLGMSPFVQGMEGDIPAEYVLVNHEGIALIDSLEHEEGWADLATLPSVQALRASNRAGFVKERRVRDRTEVISGYARTQGYGDIPDFGWGVLVRAQHAKIVEPISRLTRLVAFGGLTIMAISLGLLVTMLIRLGREIETIRDTEKEVDRRVTERTQQVADQQAQLIQTAKLASLGQLSAGVAHELNNPLNNINLMVLNVLDEVDGGLRGRQLQPRFQEKLHLIAAEVQRATSIVNNLRTFARASGSKKGLLSLADVIYRSAELLRETFRINQVEFSVQLADPKVEVWGNRVQLEQVFLNLLMNASDAVKGAAVRQITIEVLDEADQDWQLVTITDTGHGMAPETLSHIFDPFFTTKEVGQGTGLGLSIAYGIIKDHGGVISAQSEVGHGASFRFRLPMTERRIMRDGDRDALTALG
jgi:signal transduction histidine kinase